MKKTRSVMAFLWLTVAIVGISTVADAAGPPEGLNVNVVNTPNVNVSNIPEVSITNVPLLVESTDVSAKQAVFEGLFLTIPNGSAFSDEEVLLTVPEGKRLVVEFITAGVNTGEGDDKRFRVTLSLGDALNSADFIIPEPIESSIGSNVHRLAQQVTLYSDPGAEISARASRGPDTNNADSVAVKIWGHLVDVD